MSCVVLRQKESFESLMKRFKKAVEKSGILADFKKHEFYEKPSVKKKRKQAAARKRIAKEKKKQEGFKARTNFNPNSNKNFKWNKDRTKKLPMPPPRNPPQTNRARTNTSTDRRGSTTNRASYKGKRT